MSYSPGILNHMPVRNVGLVAPGYRTAYSDIIMCMVRYIVNYKHRYACKNHMSEITFLELIKWKYPFVRQVWWNVMFSGFAMPHYIPETLWHLTLRTHILTFIWQGFFFFLECHDTSLILTWKRNKECSWRKPEKGLIKFVRNENGFIFIKGEWNDFFD